MIDKGTARVPLGGFVELQVGTHGFLQSVLSKS